MSLSPVRSAITINKTPLKHNFETNVYPFNSQNSKIKLIQGNKFFFFSNRCILKDILSYLSSLQYPSYCLVTAIV